MDLFSIGVGALDPRAIEGLIAWPGAGAVLTFIGTTRDSFEGRRVLDLEYEAWPEMAVPEMEAIAGEIGQRWPGSRVAMAHRIGRVPIGEASVVISVATPHRGECYEASRYAIEQLKSRVPVWKKERFEDGAEWRANALSTPEGS